VGVSLGLRPATEKRAASGVEAEATWRIMERRRGRARRALRFRIYGRKVTSTYETKSVNDWEKWLHSFLSLCDHIIIIKIYHTFLGISIYILLTMYARMKFL
jgi:hypothetical protein